jgi:glutamate N-acetyltransferase/amino-acid N-acetyltransferase
LAFDKQGLSAAMRTPDVPIDIDLGQGGARAEIYTCDLSYDYVRINAEYTT